MLKFANPLLITLDEEAAAGNRLLLDSGLLFVGMPFAGVPASGLLN